MTYGTNECARGGPTNEESLKYYVSTLLLCAFDIHIPRKVYTYWMKGIYILNERYIPFDGEVYTFGERGVFG